VNLQLKRTDSGPDGIFGELRDVNGTLICVSLEHAYGSLSLDGKDEIWEPKVPPGTYRCVRGTHQLQDGKPPFETFMLENVPGHTGILFHKGNVESESSGCILLGTMRAGNEILNSRVAFNRFMDLQDGIDEFTLGVE
jgi:Family of unknown function (DUF5675)